MTSAVGGHGRWREIGTQRCAGAFLPAGRRDARVGDDYGSGSFGTLKKTERFVFAFCPWREASPKLQILCANDGIPVESLRFFRSRNCPFASGNYGGNQKVVVNRLLNWWFC